MQRVPPELTSSARRLRREATVEERLLWAALRRRHPRFTRQLVVDRFILDFACRSLMIGVEIDGGHHGIRIEEGMIRTAALERRGWTILRFWNNEVRDNLEAVVDAITAAAARASTHP
ncbi:MAG: endonuclease domain-containing protein [Sphingomonadaceae bacterium]|nr:endonuclease domain-containing protein [Sphingomonadaceae bacterium]